MFKKKEYITIFIIQVTEVLGFSLILPFLPFLAQSYGATEITVGLIGTVFSIFQFFSAPYMGRLSDIYGRKPLLIISQISTFFSFIVLGFANTLPLIFLSRIIDGAFGSNFTIAQAYLADVSTKKDRSIAFGISGAAFGIGFFIGPAFGGFLSRFGYGVPSFFAAGMSLLTIFLTHFLLKETVQRDPNRKFRFRDVDLINKEAFKKYVFSKSNATLAIWTLFIYNFAHMLYVSNFALFTSKRFGIGPASIGYFLTYIGLTSIILRGFLLEKLIEMFDEERLQFMGFLSLIFGMLTAVFVENPWIFLIPITLFSFGSGILRPILSGTVSRSVSSKNQGVLFGVTGALGSVAQISAPIISGFLLQYFVPGSVPLVTTFVAAAGFLLLVINTPLFQVYYNASKRK